jgi:hypothetical protein
MTDWIQTYTAKRFKFCAPTADMVSIVDIAHSTAMQCRFNGHCRDFYSVAEHQVLVAAIAAAFLAHEMFGSRWYTLKMRLANRLAVKLSPLTILKAAWRYIAEGAVSVSCKRCSSLWRERALLYIKACLLHDASEAYVKDLPSPIKAIVPSYRNMEGTIEAVIASKFYHGHDVNSFTFTLPDYEYPVHLEKAADVAALFRERSELLKELDGWADNLPRHIRCDLLAHGMRIMCLNPRQAKAYFLSACSLCGVSDGR